MLHDPTRTLPSSNHESIFQAGKPGPQGWGFGCFPRKAVQAAPGDCRCGSFAAACPVRGLDRPFPYLDLLSACSDTTAASSGSGKNIDLAHGCSLNLFEKGRLPSLPPSSPLPWPSIFIGASMDRSNLGAPTHLFWDPSLGTKRANLSLGG